MKKVIPFLLSVGLTITISISGTFAFMQYEAKGNETTSVGMVQIDQLEYERVTESGTTLQLFTPDKPLYPAVGEAVKDVVISWNTLGLDSSSMLYSSKLHNEIDKFVFVENTGIANAYVRTWFAFEQGSYTGDLLEEVIKLNINNLDWTFGTAQPDVTVNDSTYTVLYADYNSVLRVGKISEPSLLQVYMDSTVTNEIVSALDGNKNGKYEILVISQAADSEEIRETQFVNHPFGDINATTHGNTFAELKAAVESSNDVEIRSDLL